MSCMPPLDSQQSTEVPPPHNMREEDPVPRYGKQKGIQP